MKLQLLTFFGAVLYFFNAAISSKAWHLIDGANLLIHEGGHMLFQPFGQFVYISGGSLMQVVIPLLFTLYFLKEREFFSTATSLLWMGESIVNVGIYARDAEEMSLPLMGPEGVIHDWNYLLSATGVLEHAQGIGLGIQLVGFMTMCVGVCIALVYFKSRGKEQENLTRGFTLTGI